MSCLDLDRDLELAGLPEDAGDLLRLLLLCFPLSLTASDDCLAAGLKGSAFVCVSNEHVISNASTLWLVCCYDLMCSNVHCAGVHSCVVRSLQGTIYCTAKPQCKHQHQS